MNNYEDMSGLELFADPFSGTQGYSHKPSRSGSPTVSQSKTTTTQTLPGRQAAQPTQPKPVTAQTQRPDTTARPATPVEAPTRQEKANTTAPIQEQKPKTTTPASADTQPAPPKKALELDISTDNNTDITSPAADDAAKSKAHEESEAKRKAEWEAKQLAKKQAEEETLQKINDMNDSDVIAASVERIGTDIERITRRNMKECVAAHVQAVSRKNPDFARHTMHPHKSMINCFKYINRKAKEYIRQEMKDNDTQPENGAYGGDVPDGLCYQWSEDYFNDPDALEDQEKEETFTPKPYVTKSPSKPSSKATKTQKKTEAKESRKEQEQKDGYKQMSLF